MQHTKEVFGILAEVLTLIKFAIFRTSNVGAVWSICGDVAIERFWSLDRFNPLCGLVKEDIGAVAFRLLEVVIV